MAKTSGSEKVHDGSCDTGRYIDGKRDGRPLKGARREILFPTEPSTIGNDKIARAVEIVIARKK